MFSTNKQVIPILSNHFQKYNNIKIDDKSNNITIYKADFIGILQETLTASIIQNILTSSHVDNILSTLPMFSYFSYLFPHRKAFRRKETLQSFQLPPPKIIIDHFILSPLIYVINHFIIILLKFFINIIYVCTHVIIIYITVAGTFDKHSLVDSESNKYFIKS